MAGRNLRLDVAAVLLALFGIVRIAWVLPERATELDFSHYYVSSRLALEGRNPYTIPLTGFYSRYGFDEKSPVTVATNPPALIWLFAPLALLPPRVAFGVWVLVQAASLGLLLWLVRGALGDRLSPSGWRFVAGATVASVPVFYHFFFSQTQLTLAALVLAGFAMQERGRHTAACLAVTVAGLIKLFPLFLLPWFVWRSGRERWRTGLASLVLVGATVAATGPGLWRDFLNHGAPVFASWETHWNFNFSVPSFIMDLAHAGHADVKFWWPVAIATGMAILAGAYVWCWRTGRNEETQFCLLCVAMLAGSPVAWGHYFVFLIFPAVVAAVSGRHVMLLGVILVVLNLCEPKGGAFLDQHAYLKSFVNYLPMFALLGLGWLFATRQSVPQR